MRQSAHIEACPFAALALSKHKLALREKPPHFAVQFDYAKFKRASFYLDWEANLAQNTKSYSELKSLPLLDPKWVAEKIPAELMELLWQKDRPRVSGELDVFSHLHILVSLDCQHSRVVRLEV